MCVTLRVCVYVLVGACISWARCSSRGRVQPGATWVLYKRGDLGAVQEGATWVLYKRCVQGLTCACGLAHNE